MNQEEDGPRGTSAIRRGAIVLGGVFLLVVLLMVLSALIARRARGDSLLPALPPSAAPATVVPAGYPG